VAAGEGNKRGGLTQVCKKGWGVSYREGRTEKEPAKQEPAKKQTGSFGKSRREKKCNCGSQKNNLHTARSPSSPAVWVFKVRSLDWKQQPRTSLAAGRGPSKVSARGVGMGC